MLFHIKNEFISIRNLKLYIVHTANNADIPVVCVMSH